MDKRLVGLDQRKKCVRWRPSQSLLCVQRIRRTSSSWAHRPSGCPVPDHAQGRLAPRHKSSHKSNTSKFGTPCFTPSQSNKIARIVSTAPRALARFSLRFDGTNRAQRFGFHHPMSHLCTAAAQPAGHTGRSHGERLAWPPPNASLPHWAVQPPPALLVCFTRTVL